MLNVSIDCLSVLSNASVRGLLLLLVATSALTLLRVRDANVRHRVLSGVLAGMLSLPLLSGVLPSIPLPFLILPGGLPGVGQSPIELTSGRKMPFQRQSQIDSESKDVQTSAPDVMPDSEPTNSAAALRSFDSLVPQAPPATVSAEALAADSLAANDLTASGFPAAVSTNVKTGQFTEAAVVVTFVVWLGGTVILLIRMLAGLFGASALSNRGSRIEQLLQTKLAQGVSSQARMQHVKICCHKEILVPVTVGWLRPMVLLPTSWQNWSAEKLDSVLVHEFAHVARRDFLIAVLAELNRCVYWFHPAAWWLRRQLSDLAESACDDAAVGLMGNPTGYARHLLEVASVLSSGTGRRIQPGMSMARESNVESRILTILDFTRPLSRRLTWKAALLLVLVAVPVIGLAAALHPAELHPAELDADGAAVSSQPAGPDEKPSESNADNDKVRIYGRVVDPIGKGIGSARAGVFRTQRPQWYAAQRTLERIADIPIDRDGRFDTTVLHSQLFPEPEANEKAASPPVIMITADVYARFSQPLPENRDALEDILSQPLKAAMAADLPIRGRLLDLEGQPVAGARISIRDQLRCDTSELDAWLSQTSRTPLTSAEEATMRHMHGPAEAGAYFPSKITLGPGPADSSVVTDADGVFEVRGIGPDDLALLDVTRSDLAKATLHVLGRQMDPVYARHASNISQSGAYYGRQFSYVMSPSVPVSGIVRDAETRQPVAGLTVAAGGLYGSIMSQAGYILTSTDDSGRYRIEGLPIVPKGTGRYDGNKLAIRPGDLPYIENDWIMIPVGEGDLHPIEFDIELQPAVIARGRITDRESGKPVRAGLYYSPFNTNPHIANHPQYSDGVTAMLGNDTRYHTDENGEFRIPVIPGRGVLAAQCSGGEYCTEFGADAIPEFSDVNDVVRNRPTSDHLVPSLFHSLKAIDVPADSTNYQVDLQVDSGFAVDVRFVDQHGHPVDGVWATGLDSGRQGQTVQGDHSQITGLQSGKLRALYIGHKARNLMRLTQLVPAADQAELVIPVLPPAVLTGRLVDPEGAPLAGVALEVRHQNNPDFSSTLNAGSPTDQNGEFSIELPVGTTYEVIGFSDKYIRVVQGLEIATTSHIDMGDLAVDPDAKSWDSAKPQREPVITERSPAPAGTADVDRLQPREE